MDGNPPWQGRPAVRRASLKEPGEAAIPNEPSEAAFKNEGASSARVRAEEDNEKFSPKDVKKIRKIKMSFRPG